MEYGREGNRREPKTLGKRKNHTENKTTVNLVVISITSKVIERKTKL